ncbi:hypothetical protein SCHPADRAFT_947396 [Schizopora paradoxa]|uniref:Uncharacterized protein n=1 Tax=Schizopora paradoxa TaxID=27342 RepID=A0A0H2RJ21_9AGAM|nr:hypothetical protein SCHPADRAFT_947396 [Schizopora paradoxa]
MAASSIDSARRDLSIRTVVALGAANRGSRRAFETYRHRGARMYPMLALDSTLRALSIWTVNDFGGSTVKSFDGIEMIDWHGIGDELPRGRYGSRDVDTLRRRVQDRGRAAARLPAPDTSRRRFLCPRPRTPDIESSCRELSIHTVIACSGDLQNCGVTQIDCAPRGLSIYTVIACYNDFQHDAPHETIALVESFRNIPSTRF